MTAQGEALGLEALRNAVPSRPDGSVRVSQGAPAGGEDWLALPDEPDCDGLPCDGDGPGGPAGPGTTTAPFGRCAVV